jgi:hypothetical protein
LPAAELMKIAIVTFEGFNEIDSLDISKSLNLALAGTFGDCFSLYHRLTSNEKVGVSDDPFAKFSKHCRTDRLESTLVNDIFEKTK